MNKIRIASVEDDPFISKLISIALQELGYSVLKPARTFSEALRLVEKEKPDLLILDINIKGKKDGIDVAEMVNRDYKIPFIFLTANKESETIQRAKRMKPAAYLLKPFTKEDLYSSIEIALHNFYSSKKIAKPKNEIATEPIVGKHFIFLKDGSYYNKIMTDDILYIAADHVYVMVVLANKKFLVRNSLQNISLGLNPNKFIRIHKSYIANIDHLDKVSPASVVIKGQEIPVSKNYRNELKSILQIG